MKVRAIRGAIQIDSDDAHLMREAVVELMSTILTSNELTNEDLISVLFTCTPDLVSDFPAASARAMGLGQVPLICAVEMAVPGSLPRTIRVMIHCMTTRTQEEITHVYLRGATVLRKDIAQ
ncbi:MAG: chorismate mutase [Actinomycetota bacterium]